MNAPVIPQDQWFEAQAGVLGALLLDAPSCAGEIFQRTRPEHYTDSYRSVFDAAWQLHREGRPIDPVTVKGIVGDSYTQFLFQLMEITPTAANCRAYIDLLLTSAQLVQLRTAGLALADAVTADEANEAVKRIEQAAIQRPSTRILSLHDGFLDLIERMQAKPDYIPWGLPRLDGEVLVQKGDFVVLGGRPSAGKTALSLQFAWAQAKDRKVGYFSFETTPEKVYDRLASLVTGADFGRVKRHTLQPDEVMKLVDVGKQLASRHLEVIHASELTVREIRSIAANRGYDIIYTDYLQIIRPEGRSTDDLYRRVTQISMDLHALATSTGTLVVALSQLSRPTKESAAKAPTLSSLRESGQIEQDADAVLLLYRTDTESPASPRRLQIAKNKEGRTGGYIDLAFDGPRQTFSEASSHGDIVRHYTNIGKQARDAQRNRDPAQTSLPMMDLPNDTPVPF